MTRATFLALALALSALSAEEVTPTVMDLARILPPGRARVIDERLARLRERTGVELAIVLERGDHEAEDGADAASWLKDWVAQPPAEGQGEQPLRRAVAHLNLSAATASLAVSAPLSPTLSAERCTALVGQQLNPAIASQNTEHLAAALNELVRSVGEAVGARLEEPAAEAPAAARETFVPQARRPWLSAWWFVALPAALGSLLLAARLGPGWALLLGPALLALYAGLYFLLAFRPDWFAPASVLAALPLLLLIGPRPDAPALPQPACCLPVRARTSRGAGFAVTGFDGFGAGGFEVDRCR